MAEKVFKTIRPYDLNLYCFLHDISAYGDTSIMENAE